MGADASSAPEETVTNSNLRFAVRRATTSRGPRSVASIARPDLCVIDQFSERHIYRTNAHVGQSNLEIHPANATVLQSGHGRNAVPIPFLQRGVCMIERLKRLPKKIRIGIVGAGAMGQGLLYQSRVTPGIDCVAIADIDLGRAVSAAERVGCAFRTVENLNQLHDAVRDGFLAVCTDGDLVARCEQIDAFVESSSAILPAAEFALTALGHGKHLVLMNAEIDLTFGPALLAEARQKGLTYTSCDGDQHGVIRHLLDEIRLWGFEPVMAGNIKGFLDRYATPESIVAEADKRSLSYPMATAFTDGTKLAIEMALVANACGYDVTVPGMLGPRAADVHEVFDLFDFDAISRRGVPVVDYILGAEPNGGVFVVGRCENPYQRSMLAYYKMGDGPFYLFYRPYHLCHVEAMECIAAACLDGRSLLQPDFGFRTNVFAYAKRPLVRGERLDGIGGFTSYGIIENDSSADPNRGLPICLSEGVTLVRDVPRDAKIAIDDVAIEPGRRDFDLYRSARGEHPISVSP